MDEESSNKTCKFEISFYYRDEIKKGEIDVRYIETKLMITDFLTKAINCYEN